jgi:hypothetical protein
LEVVWGTAAQPDSFADSAKTCFSALDSFRVCAPAFGPTVVKNRAKTTENAKRLRQEVAAERFSTCEKEEKFMFPKVLRISARTPVLKTSPIKKAAPKVERPSSG